MPSDVFGNFAKTSGGIRIDPEDCDGRTGLRSIGCGRTGLRSIGCELIEGLVLSLGMVTGNLCLIFVFSTLGPDCCTRLFGIGDPPRDSFSTTTFVV